MNNSDTIYRRRKKKFYQYFLLANTTNPDLYFWQTTSWRLLVTSTHTNHGVKTKSTNYAQKPTVADEDTHMYVTTAKQKIK